MRSLCFIFLDLHVPVTEALKIGFRRRRRLVGGPMFEKMRVATLSIPTREGGTNSSHTHNPAKPQSYRELKLLLSDTKFTKAVNFVLILP